MSEYTQALAPTITVPRSHFNLSNTVKTTHDFDYIIPYEWYEILPGDTVSLSVTAFARLPTLLYPLMDSAYLDIYAFFAPKRILWSNARKFYGEQVDPGS